MSRQRHATRLRFCFVDHWIAGSLTLRLTERGQGSARIHEGNALRVLSPLGSNPAVSFGFTVSRILCRASLYPCSARGSSATRL